MLRRRFDRGEEFITTAHFGQSRPEPDLDVDHRHTSLARCYQHGGSALQKLFRGFHVDSHDPSLAIHRKNRGAGGVEAHAIYCLPFRPVVVTNGLRAVSFGRCCPEASKKRPCARATTCSPNCAKGFSGLRHPECRGTLPRTWRRKCCSCCIKNTAISTGWKIFFRFRSRSSDIR